MSFTKIQKEFIETFVEKIHDGDAAIFAGAGMSAGQGFIDWKGLLRDLAEELDLDVDRETDLVSLAQYHYNSFQRSKINHKIINEFTTLKTGNENHKILARLDIDTYWTTNYDQLIERTLESNGKVIDKKVRNVDFSRNVRKRDAVVYKMHGDKDAPDEAVLIKDDYETYNDKREIFSTALRGDLLSKTFLFIGFSFDDPNLDYILSRIKILLKDNTPRHYCIFRQVSASGFKDPHKTEEENKKDFHYAEVKQKLKIADLRRYGIHPVLVEEYADITKMLTEIENRIKRKTIFISGAAAKYAPYPTEEAKYLIHKLSYCLVKQNYKVVNGFGTGVGSMVINGIMDFKRLAPQLKLDDLLILRPFPQIESGERKIAEQKKEYREEMVSHAGVAIFLFGNKETEEGIINSPGLLEEFQICWAKGVIPIPVGLTGYAAREVWDIVIAELDKYYQGNQDLQSVITNLGEKKTDWDDVIDKILKAVEIIQKVK